MPKKSLCTLLLVAILFSPVHVIFANSETLGSDVLQGRLTALKEYLSLTTSPVTIQNVSPLTDEQMRSIIEEGVVWLQNAQEESGHFAYEYEPYAGTYKADDNIVRQAGALYALSEVARRDTAKDVKTNKAIEEAITYFEGLSKEHTYEGKSVRCVVKNEKSNVCKLGATALALTGILGYVEKYPSKGKEYQDLIDGYVAFLSASKMDNAGFRDEYKIGVGFRGKKESPFSNGEALLALVRYIQYEENTKVKTIIDETFSYLEKKEFDTALYLWMMAALKDMQTLWPNEAYTTYGKEFTFWRLNLLSSTRATTRNSCASTEGLASAYSLLEESMNESDKKQLRREIDLWNVKNAKLQITSENEYRVDITNGMFSFKKLADSKQAEGGFLTAQNELTQRIDFTQHCVSTYVQTLVDIDKKSL